MKIYGPRGVIMLRKRSSILYLFGDNHTQRLTERAGRGQSIVDFCRHLENEHPGRFRLFLETVSTAPDRKDLRWMSRLSVAFPHHVNVNAVRESVSYSMMGHALREFSADGAVFPILQDLCRSITLRPVTEPLVQFSCDKAFLAPHKKELEDWLATPEAGHQEKRLIRFCEIVLCLPDDAPEPKRLCSVLESTDDLLSRMEMYYNRVMEAHLIHLLTQGSRSVVDVVYMGENHTHPVADHLVARHGYEVIADLKGNSSGEDQFVILSQQKTWTPRNTLSNHQNRGR